MDDVRIPGIGVTVWVAGFDVAVWAFYPGKTPHDAIEVVTSLYDMGDRNNVGEVLQECLKTLRADGWLTLDELDTRPVEDKNSPPF